MEQKNSATKIILIILGVLIFIHLFTKARINLRNTLKPIILVQGPIITFDFNYDRTKLYYIKKNADSKYSLDIYDLKTNKTTHLLTIQDYTFSFRDPQDTYYFANVRRAYGIATGQLISFNLHSRDKKTYSIVTPPSTFNPRDYWQKDKVKRTEQERNHICNTFLEQNKSITGVHFGDYETSWFLLGTDQTFIPQNYCTEDQLKSIFINVVPPFIQANTNFSTTDKEWIDTKANIKVKLVNERCWNDCTYGYELTRGTDYYFSKTPLGLAESDYFTDAQDRIILWQNRNIVMLVKK